jgi:folate-binding protein YgfZ
MLSPTAHDGLLKVSGIDAKKFLQGQLSCDVEAITSTQTSLGAHCNPQGRVISLFRLFLYQDAYYLLMPASMINIAMQALKKYAVFFKVEMNDASAALSDIAEQVSLENYTDILKGIPAIYPETSGKFLPHDLNLPNLNAVNFHKGCYTGQEIIARMHYKATLKNRLYHATINSPITIQPGMEVYCNANQTKQVVGTVVDVSKEEQPTHVLLLTDTKNAQNEHLFLAQNDNVFFTILN